MELLKENPDRCDHGVSLSEECEDCNKRFGHLDTPLINLEPFRR